MNEEKRAHGKAVIILTAAIIIFGAASAGVAEQKVAAFLKAYPSDYAGKCPATITFRGKIENHTVFSPAMPVTVKYIFVRSDNAVDTDVKTITVPPDGSVNVSATWTLGDAVKLPSYQGWEAIKVISPEELFSNRAAFAVKCLKKVPFQSTNIR